MKISSKKYAQALFESVKGKDREGIERATRGLVKVLISRRDTNKTEKIMEHFRELWNREYGIVEAEAITAEEPRGDTSEIIQNYIFQLTGAEEVKVKNSTDKNILGGVIIRYKDKVIDASLRSRVKQLKNKMIK